MIILSCIVYGMAFDFFNISGSLFVETQTQPSIRASAQGLFMMMTNGFGAVLGSSLSGLIIQHYFTDANGCQGLAPHLAHVCGLLAGHCRAVRAHFQAQAHHPARRNCQYPSSPCFRSSKRR